jgi:hypothetical protein
MNCNDYEPYLGTGEERKERFVIIWDFMQDDLKLTGPELRVYAVIYGMHRSYCDCFCGSIEYLMKKSDCGKTSAQNALRSLERKKLITKEFRQYVNVRKAVYFINTDALPTCEMFALENRHRDNKAKMVPKTTTKLMSKTS